MGRGARAVIAGLELSVMEIHIFSHDHAWKFARRAPKQYDVIIVSNRADDYPLDLHEVCNDVLKLTFHDVDHDESPYRMPQLEDVQRGLEWARGRSKIISACQAGISRSSALAFLCKLQECGDVQEAATVWRMGYHWPNKRIIELGAQLLQQPQALDVYARFTETANARLTQPRN
jgi:predicted protein tyrosine phosphatase